MKLLSLLAGPLARTPIRTVLHPLDRQVAWARTPDWFASGLVLESGVSDGVVEPRGRVDVAVHVPEIRIARVDLPGVRSGEARQIARRRCQALLEEDPETLHVSSLVRTGKAGCVLWLVDHDQ